VTYIRKSKISPHVYTLSISTRKNQSTEARGELYIPTYEYNYKVITRCDSILYEYYITDRRKCENTKLCISMNDTKCAHEFTEEKLKRHAGEPARIALQIVCRWSTLQLHHSDQQLGESTRSKLWDLDMRIQGSENSPASGDANAKWCAKVSTRITINLNHKYALKIVPWAQAYRSKREIASDIK